MPRSYRQPAQPSARTASLGWYNALALAASTLCAPALAQAAPQEESTESAASGASLADRFMAADAARDGRDFARAEALYRQLIADTDGELRIEARYRLALMLDGTGKPRQAIAELQEILAEKPDQPGIRLILARMLTAVGESRAARREYQLAQAAGLPPDVTALVDQFLGALRSSKKVGGSLSLVVAPDSNINRSTGSDTIATVFTPFTLSEDARAQSGIGTSLAAQGYARLPLADRLSLLAKLNGQADLYPGKPQFNDIRGGGQVGLEWQSAKSRISPGIGRSYRWYGGELYATATAFSLTWTHQASRKTSIEAAFAANRAVYADNAALDGWIYDASLSYQRNLSNRDGVSVGLSVQRQAAADPAYATTSGGVEGLYWRQVGKVSLAGSLALRRLEADERINLLPERRRDWLVSATAAASFANTRVAGFSPLARINYSRNFSTVELYDYSRIRLELGLVRTF